MADNSARIAEIQEVLRAGAKTVVIEGTTVTYDFDELRRQLRQLMNEDPNYQGRRPLTGSFDLSTAF